MRSLPALVVASQRKHAEALLATTVTTTQPERTSSGLQGRSAHPSGRAVSRALALLKHHRRGLVELCLPVALYLVYLSTRIRSTRAVDDALTNARNLVAWERDAGWLIERRAQELIIGHAPIAVAMNLLYVIPHFLAVLGFLWWAYRYRPMSYPFARNLFLLSSLVSFVVFVVYPVAPPNDLPELGIADTMVQFGPVSYAMGADPFRNAVAAMPSVHIVYAAIASFGFGLLARQWWVKPLALLYVPLAVFTIMATGNHYVADAVGAIVPLAAGVALALLAGRLEMRFGRSEPANLRFGGLKSG